MCYYWRRRDHPGALRGGDLHSGFIPKREFVWGTPLKSKEVRTNRLEIENANRHANRNANLCAHRHANRQCKSTMQFNMQIEMQIYIQIDMHIDNANRHANRHANRNANRNPNRNANRIGMCTYTYTTTLRVIRRLRGEGASNGQQW